MRDSKGLSQQLCASVSHDFDPDGADEQEIAETMGRLIEKTERVGIAVKPADCSLLTTLDDVQELVDAVTATAREL